MLATSGLLYQVVTAQNPPAASPACTINGRVVSGTTPLPGVSLIVSVDGERRGQATTNASGAFTLRLAPGGRYGLTADLAFFQTVTRDLATATGACDQSLNLEMALQPRQAPAPPVAAGRGSAPGRGGASTQLPRFETLNVQADTGAAAALDTGTNTDAELSRLLPPGFSVDAAASDAVAINGSGDAATIDRRSLNDRFDAIGRGDFDPAAFAGGFGAGGGPGFGPGGPGGFGGPGGGGPGGFGQGGPGPGGPGAFFIGGRGGNQSAYRGATNYSFGGSLLDNAPFQLRPEVPVTQPQFARNTFGGTIGGPFKIPGLYENTNRRSNFQLNYNGNRSNNVFNQYATVPTDAMRTGDFSASGVALIDPSTGQPFPNNQIPTSRMNGAALAFLGYIPRANLPGTAQNYQLTTLARTSADDVSLRFTQNLSTTTAAAGRGGANGGGRGGGGRGGFGGLGGPGRGRGAAPAGTNIILNGQLQVRHSESAQPNIFTALGSESSNTSVAVPLSLNIIRGRNFQNINVNVTHATSSATNDFSGISDVSGQAGIQYPGATSVDALNWGIPNLSFSTFSSARLGAATARTDDRLTASYAWMRPIGRHQLRIGGDYRLDRSANQNNSNARGSFSFTGLYTAPGAEVAGRSGADFADFLLGMPQQATLQSGGTTHLKGQSFNAFVEDNWRRGNRLTFNLGLRYELVLPYTESNGLMANLDVAPGFTGASAVTAGGTGLFTGAFPAGLVDADLNNLGPRVGVAYRLANNTVLRGGYSLTYNNGSYAQIARQLSAQPPFTLTQTILGSTTTPLALQSALLASTSTTTNNWGVDRNYALGNIHTWNAALSRDISRNWSLFFNYTGTRGSNLDILRAPNRDPNGLRIPGVQAFIWESSEGHSLMNSGTFQIRRRFASGVSANASYTLAKSMDNASSLGAGATVVAQNDQDLEAEWARSNFDRRHQLTAQATWELPFGVNRRWLANGGLLAAFAGSWNASTNFSYQSGSPFTARVIGAASDAARGTSGSLRANYDGAAVAIDDPTITQFFNTAAFSVPAAGTFGTSARNTIVGPSARQLNAQFSRDLRLGGNRGMTLSLNAQNILNTVQWNSIDTNLNSPTFGQVLSVRPLRTMTANLRVRF